MITPGVLNYISLMSSNVEHFVRNPLTIFMFALDKCLLMTFVNYLLWLIVFL
jgi:hypothetical protein